jgi:hypothetical protein
MRASDKATEANRCQGALASRFSKNQCGERVAAPTAFLRAIPILFVTAAPKAAITGNPGGFRIAPR